MDKHFVQKVSHEVDTAIHRRLFARQALAAAHPLGHEDSGGALFGRFRSAEFFGPLGLWTGSDRRLGRFSPVFGRPFSRGWGETCPDPVAPATVCKLNSCFNLSYKNKKSKILSITNLF